MSKLILAMCLAVAACDSSNRPPSTQAGTPERAQQDSIIGASKLPGAGAVDKANTARESSNARVNTFDSLQNALDSIK